MSNVFLLSYCALWGLVLILLCAMFALYRHHGIMIYNTRQGRAEQGPAIDRKAPSKAIELLEPDRIRGPFLAVFGSADCRLCEQALRSLWLASAPFMDRVQVLVVWRGNPLPQVPSSSGTIVISDNDGSAFRAWAIAATPFAVLVDHEMVVRGKFMIPAGQVKEAIEDSVKNLSDLIEPILNSITWRRSLAEVVEGAASD